MDQTKKKINGINGYTDRSLGKVAERHEIFKSSYGIKYPTNRDHPLHSGDIWLDGKRVDDGAEGLWRIHDELYDLTDFVASHPGGSEWLRITKGTDITEAFETHHIRDVAERVLPKYFERKAKTPRNYPFTFHENGFYKTLKRRIRTEVEKVPHRYVIQSEIIADSLLAAYLLSSWLAAYTYSFVLGIIAGIILSYSTVAAHNFFHKKDNFRMYYFDFSMMSSREWRISHAMSHHLFPNTLLDLEVSSVEPWFQWLPFKKPMIRSYISWLYSPVILVFIFYVHWAKTLIANITVRRRIPVATFLPFTVFIMQYMTTNQGFIYCGIMYLWIIAFASLHFGLVGVNAAHHHPMLFHDGDTPRPKEELDFGVFQMDAVADRKDINGSPFLVLTHYGDHALHHLFPTIDHGKLEFLYEPFIKTCEDFGIEWKCTSQLELVKGQYLQLARDINPEAPKKMKKLVIEE